nr:VOC family protein [Paenibacillus daejeonensis]
MQVNSFYPVLMTDKVAETADFYKRYFGFETTFEADWYVSLSLKGASASYELAILDGSHPTVPRAFQGTVGGLLLNFEVDDAEQEYNRLIRDAGLPLHLELRDEAFGQRHFITSDPSGVLIDMIQVIPPSEEFLAQYAGAEAAESQ